MLEVIGEFLDTTVRLALKRWFPAWVRSSLAAVVMLAVGLAWKRLPAWGRALSYGHWLSLALTVTLGTGGWLLFRLPFTRGARGRLFPWLWSGAALAALVTLLVTAHVRGRPEVGFAEWYAVTAWALAQLWFLRQARSGASAVQLFEAFLLRSLYGVPVFFATCCLAGEPGAPAQGQAYQAATFHAVMLWVNHRLLVRHGR